jgi:hypothetical protein
MTRLDHLSRRGSGRLPNKRRRRTRRRRRSLAEKGAAGCFLTLLLESRTKKVVEGSWILLELLALELEPHPTTPTTRTSLLGLHLPGRQELAPRRSRRRDGRRARYHLGVVFR